MILSANNIDKTFPGQTLFKDASFLLNEHDKAAIVGMNGAGKTTLLKMLTSLESPDNGIVMISKDTSIGYLAQENDTSCEETIYEMMLSKRKDLTEMENTLEKLRSELEGSDDHELIQRYSTLSEEFEKKGGYTYKSMLTGTLKGLGFNDDDLDRSVNTLSGGQKTRAHLASLLFSQPDLIILDEPTNHLDIAATEWLETFLKNYKGTVLLVSHDRYFLDNIVNKVIAIEERQLITYQGNFTAYAEKSEARYEARLNEWYRQQEQIHHEEKVIEKLKSFNREKSIKRAESREKKLEKIERIDKPEALKDKMRLTLMPRNESGKDVLDVAHLAKSFDSLKLFDSTDIFLKRGEHVAIIGDNGTGKTTLLKIIAGLEAAEDGTITLGTNVRVGYYDQEHQELSEEKTLFEEISDAYPDLDNTRIRNTLAAFLFTGEDVYKKVSALSGGEKGRLSLAKLMLSGANFLILDEPTNHLDIESRQILQDAVNNYDGTLLYVSHDRYFVNHTAHRILHLSNGRFYPYNGNYDYFLEKRADVEKNTFGNTAESLSSNTSGSKAGTLGQEARAFNSSSSDTSPAGKDLSSKDLWQKQKAEQSRMKRQQQLLEKCEKKISSLEEELKETEKNLSDPGNGQNLSLLTELTKKQVALNDELEALYEEWDRLAADTQ